MQRSTDRVTAEINANQRHIQRTPFISSSSANTSTSSLDTQSSRLSRKSSTHRNHRNHHHSDSLYQNQPDALVRKSSSHRSTGAMLDGGNNDLMRKTSFHHSNQLSRKNSAHDSSKLTRQSSLRYDNLAQQQTDKEKEKEDRRRKRNRESARRARERERSERELMEHAYDANEVRIKQLEDIVDELSSELRRHNTISTSRPHSGSRSIYTHGNNNITNVTSNGASHSGDGNMNVQDERPSWFGAAF